MKEKEPRASFSVAPPTTQVTVTGRAEMEKALRLYPKIFWKRQRGHLHVTLIIIARLLLHLIYKLDRMYVCTGKNMLCFFSL